MLDVISTSQKSLDIEPISVEKTKEVTEKETHKSNRELNEPKPFTKEDLQSVKKLINILNIIPESELKFGFHEEGRMGIVKVMNKDNNKLIRQFPSEEFFDRLIYFRDNILPGLLLDEKV
jgi:flagellar protein FlaG